MPCLRPSPGSREAPPGSDPIAPPPAPEHHGNCRWRVFALTWARSHLKEKFLLLRRHLGPRRPRLGHAAHACRRRPPCLDVPLALVKHARGRHQVPNSGCRVRLLGCGRCRIQLAVTLLDPSGAEMTLHCDADMVRPIVGTREIKFLSGPAGSQGQDPLAQARRAGCASR